MLVGRVICGFCGGMFSLLTPIYIGEIADKKRRCCLLTYFHLLINCGLMYAFVLGNVMGEASSLWLYNVVCAVACFPIALVILLPESPLYYLTKEDESSARISLMWFRGERDNDAYRINQELGELRRLATLLNGQVNLIYQTTTFTPCITDCFKLIPYPWSKYHFAFSDDFL